MTKKLRAVTDGDVPIPPMSVFDAAESGSRLEELRAIRAVLARAIDDSNTSPRDLAALTRRQIEVSREIEALKAEEVEEEKGSNGAIADAKWRPQAI